jgi:hypothetical protein
MGWRSWLAFIALLAPCLTATRGSTEAWAGFPDPIGTVLDNTRPLEHSRGDRLPLFLWPAHSGVVQDEALQERIIRALDARGIALIASWNFGQLETSLADSMRVARIQQRLGLRVCVNANDCMYGFFNGDETTAHLTERGEPFFDPSIPGKIGCPFRLAHRYDVMREKIDAFARAYRAAALPLDFVFGDWEIDGPLEINRAWEAAKQCVVCRRHIEAIEDFRVFQRRVRMERSQATRQCFAEPLLKHYPEALVGNYGVYPNDGFRYWYDYFEVFYEPHPHRRDQRAAYREWPNDFPRTGYTLAMPVVYPWARIFSWYDFQPTDYRWFYNLLLVGSNAGRHTDPRTSIVPFVHYHTIFDGGAPDPSVKPLSRDTYREILWHLLLRGCDSFFMWCPSSQAADETALVHPIWAAALEYRDWLDRGQPITFAVPTTPGPVISGLRVDDRVLVRRTDFDGNASADVELQVGSHTVLVPPGDGSCRIITLH